MLGNVQQKNINSILDNVFGNDLYNFQKTYNGIGGSNGVQWQGVPYLYPTYDTTIHNENTNWEHSEETFENSDQ